MCGLVGIAGSLAFPDEAAMKRLLIFDYLRGTDSTGFAALRRNGETPLVKVASHPIDLFDMKRFTEALSAYNSYVFLGHNRAATKGKVNGLNAHPFKFGHIVGAHNGTLDLKSWDRLEDAIGYKTDVDSAAIFAAMEKIGVEETIGLMQEGRTSVDGAWALSWIDTKEGTLNFLRNKHRPLWYAYSKAFNKLIWASEHPMIEAATSLGTKNMELYEDKEGYRFWEMYPDWWYRFDVEELAGGFKSRPKARVKELKGREPAPAAPSATGAAPFTPVGQNGYGQTTTAGYIETTYGQKSQTSKKTGSGSNSGTSGGQSPAVIEISLASVTRPYGDYFTEDQFRHLAKYGCSWCEADVSYYDIGVTVFEDTDHILCPKCSGNGGITRVYTPRLEMDEYAKRQAA